ncbi:MAG: hypothetical protein K6G00_02050 [Treponema sp.]|nr:hypothetical protein [Treponema sp.]
MGNKYEITLNDINQEIESILYNLNLLIETCSNSSKIDELYSELTTQIEKYKTNLSHYRRQDLPYSLGFRLNRNIKKDNWKYLGYAQCFAEAYHYAENSGYTWREFIHLCAAPEDEYTNPFPTGHKFNYRKKGTKSLFCKKYSHIRNVNAIQLSTEVMTYIFSMHRAVRDAIENM